ncbi:hypothetical protein OH805_25460 [Streptomyces sp. NBC_00879]|uniref:hypothetical protein n=1 Tax=Streptomyces sp. NBC_00879 TaxID=2975855 RepID=UPI003867DD9F|nr:hypothetical protein OH805_25460 [Streptomyces sp. NBC_00879]
MSSAVETNGGSVDGLLEAGAVLPLGSEDGGPGDELTARAYAHPALDGRTVVRLVPEAIGPAEDLSLEYLGFTGSGAAPVGRVRRQSLGFPAWALVHDPDNGHHALAVVKEMERLARLVTTKPGLAKDGFDELGERLDRSVPHFLPTFYEQAARLFLAAESRQHASIFFGKARAAEQRHALAVDEERLREVFLEFAGAGALSGKALREYAKGLATRLSAAEAYAQFRAVSAQRCAAGLTPYAGMVEDLRRLAKAAGLDAGAEERALIAEIIHTGAMNRAAASFWKSALPALADAAAGDQAVRERLLALFPVVGGDSPEAFDESWLAVLDRCGAIGLLLDGTVPAAEWVSSWARHRQRGWRGMKRLSAEQTLVERLAQRLIADGTPLRLLRGGGWRTTVDLDLLDLCLALGVPVEHPSDDMENLELAPWLSDEREGRRDLAALGADARFARVLRGGVERLAGAHEAPAQLSRIAEHPALRTALAGWIGDRADDLERPHGLPGMDGLLGRLSKFSAPAVLAAAPEAVERITAVSPAGALARTLRAGILDELGWPALEEAVPELGKVNPMAAGQQYGHLVNEWYRLSDAWPALVVRVGMQAAAVGPRAVLDRQTLSLPVRSANTWDVPTVRYVGGQWLVANGHGAERRARWSGSAAEVFKPEGELNDHWMSNQMPSLAVPGGGRTFGGRPVHAGDTSFAAERRMIASDGISVWVLHEHKWWEYDPESARRGRVSVPAFFDSALAEGGSGALVEHYCRLLPVQQGLESSPFGTKDGLLGWWVRYDPQARTLTAHSVDGSRGPAVEIPAGSRVEHLTHGIPLPPLRLPAGAALHPRESRGYNATISLHDTEGVLLATFQEGDRGGAHAAGTPLVPPIGYWHALRPRDERGSAALRAVTEADAQALLAAVADGAKPDAAVAKLLPEITHPGLAAGVAGLVEEAARHGARIGVLAERAAKGQREPAHEQTGPVVRHAFDGDLQDALGGFLGSRNFYGHSWDLDATSAMDQLRVLRQVLEPGADEANAELSGTYLGWLTLPGAGMAAAAVRAASPATEEGNRAALLEFLDAALEVRADGDAVLVDPRGRLRLVQLKSERTSTNRELIGAVRHSGARRLLIIACQRVDSTDAYWNGIEYDPAGSFGAWDGFALAESEVLGTADDPLRADSVRALVDAVRRLGPLPYRPEQAQEFAAQVGVSPVTGALLQLGLPGINGYGRHALPAAQYLAPLGAKTAEAQTGRAVLGAMSPAQRQVFTGLLLPEEPARVDELWTEGFDLEPLTGAWLAARGKRRVAPSWLISRVVAEIGPGAMLDSVLNPAAQTELTGRTQQVSDGESPVPAEPEKLLTGSAMGAYVGMLRWLAYRLPYGDPLREVLPLTLRMLRERLADPGLLLDLGVDWDTEGNATSKRLRESHRLPLKREGSKDGLVELSDALVLSPTRYTSEWDSVWVRPAALLTGEGGGPDHPALKLLAGISRETSLVRALRALLSEEFTALVAVDGPPGAAQYPPRTAPELVEAAAERFGLSEDAAALYLMLLALPDPTDRNQAEWTGWKPARLKKARAELAATDLVVEAKRARAGRSLFLPGGWLEQKTPRLPAENWKTALVPWDLYGFVVPDRPVAQLYAAAWQRVLDGDAPGFEEFKGRSGRGGSR